MSLWKMLWIWTSAKNLWMIIVVIVRISLIYCLLKFFQYWYLIFGEFQGYYIFVELCYFIFVKLCYFEFWLKCIHLLWGVKNLFLDECYIFVELYYFECRLKTWSICTAFWDVKKIIFRWMLYLILCKLKWVVLHSCQSNMIRLLSVSNELGQVNTPY